MTDLNNLRWEPYDRHWVRLRGPWHVEWIDPPLENLQREAPSGIASGRVTLPADWKSLFGEQRGTARYERRFQRPTNMEPEERVLLTLCEVRCRVSAHLNERLLNPLDDDVGDPDCTPCHDRLSYDITELIEASNLLKLDVTNDATDDAQSPCGLWQPVLLEIITPE